jgi:hypothetical protein
MPFTEFLIAAMILSAMILAGVALMVRPESIWKKVETELLAPFESDDSSQVLIALRCAGGMLLIIAQNVLWRTLNS